MRGLRWGTLPGCRRPSSARVCVERALPTLSCTGCTLRASRLPRAPLQALPPQVAVPHWIMRASGQCSPFPSPDDTIYFLPLQRDGSRDRMQGGVVVLVPCVWLAGSLGTLPPVCLKLSDIRWGVSLIHGWTPGCVYAAAAVSPTCGPLRDRVFAPPVARVRPHAGFPVSRQAAVRTPGFLTRAPHQLKTAPRLGVRVCGGQTSGTHSCLFCWSDFNFYCFSLCCHFLCFPASDHMGFIILFG